MEIEIKDFETKQETNQWTSCCFENPTDSRLLKFVVVYFIILMIITFSLYQLSLSDTCETQTTYISLLTLILGIVLPSPKK